MTTPPPMPTELFVTRRALEEAVQLLPPETLAVVLGGATGRAAQDRLRAHVGAEVLSGRWSAGRDPRSGDPQHTVWLGPRGAAWGVAVVRDGCAVVMILDTVAGGRVASRQRAVWEPVLRPDPQPKPAGVLLRYIAERLPGVEAIEILQTGEARLVLVPGRSG